jgi:hypothetical protein
MPAVEDVLRSQQNAGPYPTVPMSRRRAPGERGAEGADNENQFTTEQVLSRMVITAPAIRASWVQIYEPRQTPDQEEVILEEFAIDGGATEFRDPRSATAAFRFLPLTDQQRLALEDARNKRSARDGDEDAALALTEGQPGFMTPETADEMSAGSARQAELADAENEPRGTRTKRKASGGATRSDTANEEVQRGEEERSVPRRAPEQSKRTVEEPKKRGPKPASKRK